MSPFLPLTTSRRNMLRILPAVAAVAALKAQAKTPIRVRALNHMTLRVSDAKRSIEFYQGLFGMPIQSRQSSTVQLRIGAGPQYIALGAGGGGQNTGIAHFCMTTEDFSVDRVFKILADHGVSKSESPGPMKAWVRMRDETPEFYLGDPDGIQVQLQDPSYCGGKGALGNQCFAAPEPAPRKGLLALQGLSHFTLTASNAQRSTEFYQNVFGMRTQAHQGAGAVLAVGTGPQFVMAAGGGAATPAIGHACVTMEGFKPDAVLKVLAEYGIKPRGEARGPAQRLTSWVTMRMPDRGGAPGGTPELYFTDPDGIAIQIQDVKYCGGGGYLGEVCV